MEHECKPCQKTHTLEIYRLPHCSDHHCGKRVRVEAAKGTEPFNVLNSAIISSSDAAPSLSEQVRGLEDEAERLRNICIGIIATLRVNIGRGTLRCDAPDTFIEVVNQWAAAAGCTEPAQDTGAGSAGSSS